jgi:tetratricopeptide (TPR) repeat protein
MKSRLAWIVVVVVVVVAIVAGSRWWPSYNRAKLEKEFTRISQIEDARARLTAAVELVRGRPLDSGHLKIIADVLTNAAYELRGREGLVAVADSLAATDLPRELVVRLKADLHNGLIGLGYAAADDKKADYWRRAEKVARELLAADDVPADVYLSMAGYHTFGLDFAPADELAKTHGRYLPLELAAKGSALLKKLTSADDVFAIDRAVLAVLTPVAAERGPEAALAVADSLLKAATDRRVVAVIQANRFRLAAENDVAIAATAAKALGEAAIDPGFWELLNQVGYDMAERNIQPALALELVERSLANAPSKEDSTLVLDSVGWAHYKLGHFDEAVGILEKTIDFAAEVPSFDDVRIQHMLAAYDAAKKNDKAIELLGRFLARSVMPNDDAREKLAELLAAAGRSKDEIAGLVERLRYEGVREAPTFALSDRSGKTVALADLRGKVVLVNFWSYG